MGLAFRAYWAQTPVMRSTKGSAHVSDAKASRNRDAPKQEHFPKQEAQILNCVSGPAGIHHLYLDHLTSSSASVSWDSTHGEFDFHRVTVTNTLVTSTLTIPKEKQVAVVTGLLGGCSYNVTVERVKGVTAGRSAFLTVTTGK